MQLHMFRLFYAKLCCSFLHLRYHSTIKSVVRSPQTTVPVLLKNLLQIASVRTVTAKLASFDRQLKQPANIPTELAEYRPVLSRFAMELLKKEFRKAQSQSQSEDFTRPCTCSFSVTYRLPCRHFFAHCLQQEVSVFDDTLIDGRWAPLPPATTSSSQASVNVVTIQHNFSTCVTYCVTDKLFTLLCLELLLPRFCALLLHCCLFTCVHCLWLHYNLTLLIDAV